jgi:hypothetical protein
MISYDKFDEHIASESHKCKARLQYQFAQIDDIIGQLEEEKPWMTKWKPDPVKSKKADLKYFLTKQGKIFPAAQYYASHGKKNPSVGKLNKSGRASATAAGKASKVSLKSSATRNNNQS